jgi:hypothetical protein
MRIFSLNMDENILYNNQLTIRFPVFITKKKGQNASRFS